MWSFFLDGTLSSGFSPPLNVIHSWQEIQICWKTSINVLIRNGRHLLLKIWSKGRLSNYLRHVKSIVLNTLRMTDYKWIDIRAFCSVAHWRIDEGQAVGYVTLCLRGERRRMKGWWWEKIQIISVLHSFLNPVCEAILWMKTRCFAFLLKHPQYEVKRA